MSRAVNGVPMFVAWDAHIAHFLIVLQVFNISMAEKWSSAVC
jgi:hypothetical protein